LSNFFFWLFLAAVLTPSLAEAQPPSTQKSDQEDTKSGLTINVPIVGFKAPIPDPLAASNSSTSTIAPLPVLSPISIGIGTINGSNILLSTPTPFF